MKQTLIILVCIAFACCNPHARWIKKGQKKGWIDTATLTIDTATVAIRDTVYVDSIVKEYVSTIDTLLQRDSIFLTPESIEKIIRITKETFVPKIVRVPFIDTLRTSSPDGLVKMKQWTDDAGNIISIITYKHSTIQSPPSAWYDDWWKYIVGYLLGTFTLLLLIRR